MTTVLVIAACCMALAFLIGGFVVIIEADERDEYL